MSTLRYGTYIVLLKQSNKSSFFSLADRAKQIRTRATVNEDPTEKLARDLKVENQRLKTILTRGNIDPQWMKNAVNGRSTNPQGPLSN